MIKGIQKFYSQISGSYQLINSLLTLGLDAYWRKKAVKMAMKSSSNPERFLDICSGTGQTAAALRQSLPSNSNTQIIAADFSHHMLKIAMDRTDKKGLYNIHFTLTDAINLPFNDNTFDIITITFATRNLAAAPGHLLKSFREFHRVLKPGGVFLNLETSQPPVKFIKRLFHLYVKLTVAPVGRRISGSKGSYTYLSNSIRSFYPAKELTDILYEAGFETVTWNNLLFGVVALHQARKDSGLEP
ncbi:MAG: ubiquinone/menaquinone biosynthesis methyltransferase [Candidatus Aminicenantes bacterium]|jgi:demethylmenaquinone methyltransferase/2-methoxy-6-polyprenyl-1,4-benzoquinol methylase